MSRGVAQDDLSRGGSISMGEKVEPTRPQVREVPAKLPSSAGVRDRDPCRNQVWARRRDAANTGGGVASGVGTVRDGGGAGMCATHHERLDPSGRRSARVDLRAETDRGNFQGHGRLTRIFDRTLLATIGRAHPRCSPIMAGLLDLSTADPWSTLKARRPGPPSRMRALFFGGTGGVRSGWRWWRDEE